MQVSPPKSVDPILLIDASLADRPLADALSLVDYNAVACTRHFSGGTPDPIIIQWLGLQNGVWITADERAKRKHANEIQKSNINIVWVHRSKQGMSKKAQLLLLLWVIDPILEEVRKSNRACHYLAKYSGLRPRYKRI